MKLALRFDMRGPEFGGEFSELYNASIDQCEWADRLGFETVFLAEHHAAEDGYCPSPMIQGAAIASRTRSMMIHFSALVVTLHNPLRLAEDLAVLDLISKGRIMLTAGMGYRPHEFEMFGIEMSERLKVYLETLEVLKKAWTGEAFDYQGKTVRVTPRPYQPGGPKITMGGSTEKSARRAARMGYDFAPGHPALNNVFRDECLLVGRVPPPSPPVSGPNFLYVTHDPDRDWPIVAPHVAYATNSYAEWAKERQGGGSTTYVPIQTMDELKASPIFKVVTPEQCVEYARTLGDEGQLSLHPLFGGLDPKVAWRSLDLFEAEVLPRLKAEGLR